MCIARAADGGMRDCLSIADQCLSFCGDADSTEQKLITQQDVLSVLGSMNADFLFDFADSVLHSDTAAVMKNIEQVVSGGRDIGVFVQDLSNHFRSLLLAKVCGSCADILDCTQDTMERYLAQAESAGKARLERTLDALMQLQPNLRWVTMPRVLLESTLLKVCHPDEQTEMAALVEAAHLFPPSQKRPPIRLKVRAAVRTIRAIRTIKKRVPHLPKMKKQQPNRRFRRRPLFPTVSKCPPQRPKRKNCSAHSWRH